MLWLGKPWTYDQDTAGQWRKHGRIITVPVKSLEPVAPHVLRFTIKRTYRRDVPSEVVRLKTVPSPLEAPRYPPVMVVP
jgi:hypothetical protein